MNICSDDRVYRSKQGFFHVWKLTGSYGIYNNNGVKIANIPRFTLINKDNTDRALEMAKIMVDAIEHKFQF